MTAALTALPSPARRAAWRRALRRQHAVLIGVTASVLVAGTVLGGMWLFGLRWFVVQTPSMAGTAPVGTFVVTAPLQGRAVVGEVIAFRTPSSNRVYTHRVTSVREDGSVRTKGDLNGAADAWTTPASAVIGHAVLIVPGLGFLVEAIPPLTGGALLVLLVTARIGRRDHRSAARVLGLHLVAAAAILLLRPFVSLTVVATQSAGAHLQALVVSTGLLPVSVRVRGSDAVHRLVDGQLATITIPRGAGARAALEATLDLQWWQYGALVALTLVPAAAMLAIGLPEQPERDPEPA